MLRSLFILTLLVSILGCDVSSQYVILPDAPLTEEQKLAIVREDAESCNCGKSVDLETSTAE